MDRNILAMGFVLGALIANDRSPLLAGLGFSSDGMRVANRKLFAESIRIVAGPQRKRMPTATAIFVRLPPARARPVSLHADTIFWSIQRLPPESRFDESLAADWPDT
jgi:hypothetical protein